MIKNNKGLTMVSLLATIIIILILSFITISVIIGDSGTVNKAEGVKAQSEIEDIKEKVYLSAIKNKDESGNIDTEAILNELKEYEIENVSTDSENNKIKFEYKGQSLDVDLKQISDTTQGNYYSSTPNAPYLMSGMEPIKWIKDENGNDKEVTTSENDKEWYNYDKQLWANAKTVEDGSYWVWIPRYEYKITYYTDETKTTVSPNNEKTLYGKIDVNFIPKEKTTPTSGYKIHPAFTDGTDNHFQNGEWDKEVSGIWVSKYEMSCEISDDGVNWINKKFTLNDNGLILIEEEKIRCVSKPVNNYSEYWIFSSIGYDYANAFNYDRKKESHLMKTSEYGAELYLLYSKYGIDGDANKLEEMNPNNSTGISNKYFALYTSNYLVDGNDFHDKAYANLENFFEEGECNNLNSTKYIVKYPCHPGYANTEFTETELKNFEYYQENYETKRYGDAILECSIIQDNTILGWRKNGNRHIPNEYLGRDQQNLYGNTITYYQKAQTIKTSGAISHNNTDNGENRAGFKVVLIGE